MSFFLGWIVAGVIAGWGIGKLMEGSGFGATLDMLVGIMGAFIGGYILRIPGFTGWGGVVYSMVVAIIGACLLVVIFRLIGGRRPAL
jgi:uncharacterized membrane protein YeaQ/YmgE (transglycosylase-associated protein family)